MAISFKPLAQGLPAKSSLVAVFVSILLTGCSSAIDRFADYPGKTSQPQSTASTSSSYSGDENIQSAPLGGGAPKTATANPYQAPVYGQPSTYVPSVYRPQTSYQQPSYRPQSVYDQPAPYRAPSTYDQQAAYPTSTYGTASQLGSVVVQPGQTLYSIARAYNVPVSALASLNGIRAPYTLKTGQSLRIPGNNEPRAEAAYAPVGQNFSQKSMIHAVEPGETLFSLGRKFHVHPYAIADLNNLPHDVSLNVGQRIRVPASAGRAADAEPSLPKDDSVADADQLDAPTWNQGYAKQQQRIADEQGDENTSNFSEDAASDTSATDPSAQTSGMQVGEPVPAFRWPVKGRVISGYGMKPGGTRNEGINIAVPEGTSIRAAEDGVVAYAGNELKGYGNLILIRHEGGWVTAYAHNRDLFVKRGDTVRRGDVIAKAGQTGSVESPQLHFELRKGATAVDPMKYMQGSQTASN